MRQAEDTSPLRRLTISTRPSLVSRKNYITNIFSASKQNIWMGKSMSSKCVSTVKECVYAVDEVMLRQSSDNCNCARRTVCARDNPREPVPTRLSDCHTANSSRHTEVSRTNGRL